MCRRSSVPPARRITVFGGCFIDLSESQSIPAGGGRDWQAYRQVVPIEQAGNGVGGALSGRVGFAVATGMMSWLNSCRIRLL